MAEFGIQVTINPAGAESGKERVVRSLDAIRTKALALKEELQGTFAKTGSIQKGIRELALAIGEFKTVDDGKIRSVTTALRAFGRLDLSPKANFRGLTDELFKLDVTRIQAISQALQAASGKYGLSFNTGGLAKVVPTFEALAKIDHQRLINTSSAMRHMAGNYDITMNTKGVASSAAALAKLVGIDLKKLDQVVASTKHLSGASFTFGVDVKGVASLERLGRIPPATFTNIANGLNLIAPAAARVGAAFAHLSNISTLVPILNRINKQLLQTGAASNVASNGMQRLGTQGTSLRGILGGLGVYFSAHSILDFGKALFTAATDMNRLDSAMMVANEGSFVMAAQSMDFIKNNAKMLGIEIGRAGQEYAQLAVAASEAGVSASVSQKTFTAISVSMAVLGRTADDAKLAVLAMSQMFSKGVVQSEELRRQMSERIPGSVQMMAEAAKRAGIIVNGTVAELFAAMKVGAVETAAVAGHFADVMNETFGGQLAEAMRRPDTQLKALRAEVSLLFADIAGDYKDPGTFMYAFADGIQRVRIAMQAPEFKAFIEDLKVALPKAVHAATLVMEFLIEHAKGVAIALGMIGGAAVIGGISMVVSSIAGLSVSIAAAVPAILGSVAALGAGLTGLSAMFPPLLAFLAIGGALAGASYLIYENMSEVPTEAQKIIEAFDVTLRAAQVTGKAVDDIIERPNTGTSELETQLQMVNGQIDLVGQAFRKASADVDGFFAKRATAALAAKVGVSEADVDAAHTYVSQKAEEAGVTPEEYLLRRRTADAYGGDGERNLRLFNDMSNEGISAGQSDFLDYLTSEIEKGRELDEVLRELKDDKVVLTKLLGVSQLRDSASSLTDTLKEAHAAGVISFRQFENYGVMIAQAVQAGLDPAKVLTKEMLLLKAATDEAMRQPDFSGISSAFKKANPFLAEANERAALLSDVDKMEHDAGALKMSFEDYVKLHPELKKLGAESFEALRVAINKITDPLKGLKDELADIMGERGLIGLKGLALDLARIDLSKTKAIGAIDPLDPKGAEKAAGITNNAQASGTNAILTEQQAYADRVSGIEAANKVRAIENQLAVENTAALRGQLAAEKAKADVKAMGLLPSQAAIAAQREEELTAYYLAEANEALQISIDGKIRSMDQELKLEGMKAAQAGLTGDALAEARVQERLYTLEIQLGTEAFKARIETLTETARALEALRLEQERAARRKSIEDGYLTPDEKAARAAIEADEIGLEGYARDRFLADNGNTIWDGMKSAMYDFRDESMDVAGQAKAAFTDAFSGAKDAFVEFAKTGEFSMDKMMGSINAKLAGMAFDATLSNLFGLVLGNGLSKGGANGSGSGSGIFGGAMSFLPSLFGFANGGIMTSAGPLDVRAYDSGGIANSPQVAVYGEGKRPEAYVPLPDGRTIPVTMRGGAEGGQAVQNVSINIHTKDAESFRQSRHQLMSDAAAAVSRGSR